VTVPLLYDRLAPWWPLLSPPEEYAEEAALYRDLLAEAGALPGRTLLELGSGGGNNASHLKASYRMTLADLSPAMLEVSSALNPECEHVQGDMRSLRLGRTFDAVFVHDAIDYMTTEDDLAAALRTIASHLEPGGAFLVAADHVAETFSESTEHGGADGDGRGLRYLMWTHGPEPAGTTYLVDFAYLLREGADVRVEHDRHVNGLFPRETWARLLAEAGLEGRSLTHTFSDGSTCELFTGSKDRTEH
jgi:SAM-dependent methyltransferase